MADVRCGARAECHVSILCHLAYVILMVARAIVWVKSRMAFRGAARRIAHTVGRQACRTMSGPCRLVCVTGRTTPADDDFDARCCDVSARSFVASKVGERRQRGCSIAPRNSKRGKRFSDARASRANAGAAGESPRHARENGNRKSNPLRNRQNPASRRIAAMRLSRNCRYSFAACAGTVRGSAVSNTDPA